ncbi:MAG: hypothetical protein QM749_16525 [Aquabacterium sp.]
MDGRVEKLGDRYFSKGRLRRARAPASCAHLQYQYLRKFPPVSKAKKPCSKLVIELSAEVTLVVAPPDTWLISWADKTRIVGS